MKKPILMLALLGLAVAALGQGKVRFANDSLHLVYYVPYFGGTGSVYAGETLQDGQVLVADLYAGTSFNSMNLVATAGFSPATPGEWVPQNLTLPFAAGTDYFYVDVHEADGVYTGVNLGESEVFTANSGPSITYYNLVQEGSPVYSTWADGTYPLDAVAPGAMGAIAVYGQIPEPGGMGLAGFGLGLVAWARLGRGLQIRN